QDLKVHIFKKCTMETLSGDLFNTRYFSILLVKKGSISIQINETTKQIMAHEFIVIQAKSFCRNLNIDNKLQFHITSFTPEFAFKNSIKKSHIVYFEFFITKFPPKITLENKEVSIVTRLFQLLSDNNRNSRHLFQKEVLLFSFNLLVYEIAGIYFKHLQHTDDIR